MPWRVARIWARLSWWTTLTRTGMAATLTASLRALAALTRMAMAATDMAVTDTAVTLTAARAARARN
jgi:hypothetical protein